MDPIAQAVVPPAKARMGTLPSRRRQLPPAKKRRFAEVIRNDLCAHACNSLSKDVLTSTKTRVLIKHGGLWRYYYSIME